MATILQIHNQYLTSAGGEDTMVAEEYRMLKEHGHDVHQLLVKAGAEDIGSKWMLLRTALNNVWSFKGRRMVRDKVREVKPQIVHVHNTFPMLSPAIFWELKKYDLKRVVTFHNYRTICTNGKLLRQGKPCELCVGKGPWLGVKYRCYKNSKLGSAARALNQAVHGSLHTYQKCLDAILVPSDFTRSVFVRAGFPDTLVHAKYNFVGTIDPFPDNFEGRDKRIVFLGRVDATKGLDRLIEAWEKVDHQGHTLEIIGDGPERQAIMDRHPSVPDVEWRGWMQRDLARDRVRTAKWLIMSSLWYETFGMVLAEAFTCGTPVMAPNQGAMAEVADQGEAGLLYDSLDPTSLPKVFEQAIAMSAADRKRLARVGWDLVNSKYSPEANYRQLAQIYGLPSEA